jgi:putative phosphoribosyl transferase
MWQLPANVTENPALHNRGPVFDDRLDAGTQLAKLLPDRQGSDAIICAIPAGGVPVGIAVARELALRFDVLVVSKMTLPWNTEAGFGAMAADGTSLLNQELVDTTDLDNDAITRATDSTRAKVLRREEHYHQVIPKQGLANREVILVDDGLASGFTLRVAIESAKSQKAKHIAVAVPTGHSASVERVAALCDQVYCANVREGMRFAVADAYREWTDVSEEEVVQLLEQMQ